MVSSVESKNRIPRFLLFGFLVLVACLNPPRPTPPIPMRIEREDIPIEFKLSNRLYANNDWIELSDPRITPERFRGIYLRMIWKDKPLLENKEVEETEYMDIEHLPGMRVVVSAGKVAVIDPKEGLLQFATIKRPFVKGLQAHIVIYVTP